MIRLLIKFFFYKLFENKMHPSSDNQRRTRSLNKRKNHTRTCATTLTLSVIYWCRAVNFYAALYRKHTYEDMIRNVYKFTRAPWGASFSWRQITSGYHHLVLLMEVGDDYVMRWGNKLTNFRLEGCKVFLEFSQFGGFFDRFFNVLIDRWLSFRFYLANL